MFLRNYESFSFDFFHNEYYKEAIYMWYVNAIVIAILNVNYGEYE